MSLSQPQSPEEFLDEALTRLSSGEALAVIVASYPNVAAELEPLLRAAATVQNVAPPSASISAAAMSRIMARAQMGVAGPAASAAAASAKTASVVVPEVSSGPSLLTRLLGWLPVSSAKLGTALLAGLALVLVVGGIVFASVILQPQQTTFSYDGAIGRFDNQSWDIGGHTVYLDDATEITGAPAIGRTAHAEGQITAEGRDRATRINVDPTAGETTTPGAQTPDAGGTRTPDAQTPVPTGGAEVTPVDDLGPTVTASSNTPIAGANGATPTGPQATAAALSTVTPITSSNGSGTPLPSAAPATMPVAATPDDTVVTPGASPSPESLVTPTPSSEATITPGGPSTPSATPGEPISLPSATTTTESPVPAATAGELTPLATASATASGKAPTATTPAEGPVEPQPCVSGTITASPTTGPTNTPNTTATATATRAPGRVPTCTPIPTATTTATSSATGTPTITPTGTPTSTQTATATATLTVGPEATPRGLATATITAKATTTSSEPEETASTEPTRDLLQPTRTAGPTEDGETPEPTEESEAGKTPEPTEESED